MNKFVFLLTRVNISEVYKYKRPVGFGIAYSFDLEFPNIILIWIIYSRDLELPILWFLAFPILWIWNCLVYGFGITNSMGLELPILCLWNCLVYGFGIVLFMDLELPCLYIWNFLVYIFGIALSMDLCSK